MNTVELRIGESWYKKLETEFKQPYIQELSKFVSQERKEYTVYPAGEDVFKAYRLTPFHQVQVIIIGQDPYPHKYASGLAFSSSNERVTPASLKNIFKEIESDTGSTNKDPDLERWAKQGVFLLNRTLTVRKGEPFSHANKGWEEFTLRTIQKLCTSWKPKVFMLWGRSAQKLEKAIPKHHLVLKSTHPSPLSAHSGFFGSKHFSQANEFLNRQNLKTINW